MIYIKLNTMKILPRTNSPLQETVHVRELVNSNMCFVCERCLSVCVFLFALFGVIGTGYIRRWILYNMSGVN